MTDRFDGDPLLVIDGDGADFEFVGGQPVMDQGLLNHVSISLLTRSGWWGNDLEKDDNKRIGAEVLTKANKPITRQSLIDVDREIESVLKKGDYFRSVTSETTNPAHQNVLSNVKLQAPSGEISVLRLTRVGQNWISQIFDDVNSTFNGE